MRMNALTKPKTRRRERLPGPREPHLEKEKQFWARESDFFIRLLSQSKEVCRASEHREYDELIARFQSVRNGDLEGMMPERRSKVELEFNPHNQTFTRKQVSHGPPDHHELKERFYQLKEEAFQKIGRFFKVKIR